MRLFPPLRPELVAMVLVALAGPASAEPAPAKPGAAAPAKATAARKTQGITYAVDGDALFLTDARAQKTYRLHPLAAAVYALADGQKPLAAIRAEAEQSSGLPVDDDTLYAVLDALADADLLVARVTPPGSSDLGSFVAIDGTPGPALVALAPAKAGTLGLAEARVSEEKEKVVRRPGRKLEAEKKRADASLMKSQEERVKARDLSLRERVGESANKEASQKSARPIDAALEKRAGDTRLRAEQLAKSESQLRMRSEAEAKKADVSRMRSEEEAKVKKPAERDDARNKESAMKTQR
jgi:hypothetical protein